VSYTVTFAPSADRQLMIELLRASDKQQLLRAGRTIENLLRRIPHGVGESRGFGERLIFERPLYVLYTINDEQRIVRIEYVRWVGF
jgi:mRNA-degrading endonuclease RelE of RelBE toxin-antitoxin system